MNPRNVPSSQSVSPLRADVLSGAVRHALRRPRLRLAGLLAVGLAFGPIQIASAEPFPAVFPLASLLPGAGGDGSAGFVLNGIARR